MIEPLIALSRPGDLAPRWLEHLTRRRRGGVARPAGTARPVPGGWRMESARSDVAPPPTADASVGDGVVIRTAVGELHPRRI